MVVWCPDWPVVAAIAAEELSADDPVAVVAANEVLACSAAARLDGVRRGMRRRDAVGRCPELTVVDANETRDLRAYELVLSGLEQLVATVTPIRAGICALPVPRRFYGGEPQAAAVIAEMLVEYGVWDCRVGIADGMFAAEQAARRAEAQSWFVVPPQGSARFLAELEISALEDAELVSLLRRLGIRRLGEFAALSAGDVATRFGRHGSWLHRLSRGTDVRVAAGRRPPLELTQRVVFEPPLETIEPIAFSTRQTADRFVAELSRHGLVCTTVTVEVRGDRGWQGVRTWGHPRWFGSADLVDRVFWQLQSDPAPEPVCEVRLVPESVESLGDHGDGLWGSATDDRVERGVARLQGMLGPEAVVAPDGAGRSGGRPAAGGRALGGAGRGSAAAVPAVAGQHPAARADPGLPVSPAGDRGRPGRPLGGRVGSRSGDRGADPLPSRSGRSGAGGAGLGGSVADRRAVVGPGRRPAGRPLPAGRSGRQRLVAAGGARRMVDRSSL